MEPGQLLREARRRSRLSQYEVAALAGCSQSAVARAESEERTPSLTMFERMLGACGCQLAAELEPLDTVLDQQIAALAAEETLTSLRILGSKLLNVALPLADAGLSFAVDGVAAAILYGFPLPCEDVQLRIQDDPDVLLRFARTLTLRRDIEPEISPYRKDLEALPRLRYIYDLRDVDTHWLVGFVRLRVRTQLTDPQSDAVAITVLDYDRQATVPVVPLQRLTLPRKYARALERTRTRLANVEHVAQAGSDGQGPKSSSSSP